MTFDVCNWLLAFLIEFTQSTWFTTIKSIGKLFQKNSWKFFQLTFSLQLTLVNCTWSGPKYNVRITSSSYLHLPTARMIVLWVVIIFICIAANLILHNSNQILIVLYTVSDYWIHVFKTIYFWCLLISCLICPSILIPFLYFFIYFSKCIIGS